MKVRRVLLEAARFLLGGILLLSGFLKAVDPMGSALKISDYISTLLGSDWTWLADLSMLLAICLCVLEFSLGAFLIMGIYRRLTTRITFALMILMTLVTIYVYVTGVLPDCGCFGDAIKLTNLQTLLKNVLLLPLAYWLMRSDRRMGHLFSRRERWVPALLAILGITLFTYYNYFYLPYVDFRPYRIGYNLQEMIQREDSTYQAALLAGTKYVYERGGEEYAFSLDQLPDSTWSFVRLEQNPQLQNYKPTYFFELRDEFGQQREDEILQDSIGTVLLLSTNWIKADQRHLPEIGELYRSAREKGYRFYGVSASTPEEEAEWRYRTGADYPILFSDATTIKTIVRSNPAVMLLRRGVIVDKVAVSMLPSVERIPSYLDTRMLDGQSSLPSPYRLILLYIWLAMVLLAILRVGARHLNIIGNRSIQESEN